MINIYTSGNSFSILNAVSAAKAIGIGVIGFTWLSGGKLKPMFVVCICAAFDSTSHVQEYHLAIEHAMFEVIEAALYGEFCR